MKGKETFYQSLGFSGYRKYFFVLLLLFVGLIAKSQDTTLTVISNIKGAPSNMKMAELKSILNGEKDRWSDKTKVSVVMMKTTTPIGKSACSKIYQMDPEEVATARLLLEFGQKARVKTCNSIGELESFIAENPGAIGVTGKFSNTPNIKVIMIDGKKSF